MKTKKIFLFMLLLVTVGACKYDDDALWEKVNSLDERVKKIEDQLKTINGDISSVKTIIAALQNNVYVKSVSSTANGYVIEFTNGTNATISNGEKGEDGKDAPVIGVGVFEGKYYWTKTLNGETNWLNGVDGEKLPVTGADGIDGNDGADAVTPQLKVDPDGYWMISYDNGATFTLLLDNAGNPAKAIGKDGIDGTNGTNGLNGDSFFQSVTVNGRIVTITMADGTEFKLQMMEDLPQFIALNQNLGDKVDYAILGLDNSGYFYEFQDENKKLPKRLSIYDGGEGKISLMINFNNEGLPVNILSEEFTIVLGKFVENKYNAIFITKEGETHLFENIENDISWDDYKNGLTEEVDSRALSRSPIKWVNAIVSSVGCGLSIASAPTGIGVALTVISCSSAIASIADAAGLVEIPQGVAIGSTIITHYANLISCGSVGTAVACVVAITNNVTAIGDIIYDTATEEIVLGEGSLISGNGEIKLTLTWDNYADIDLHCIDPSGYHIYYADKVSGTGGFLDYDNVEAYGPENIYFNPAPAGPYKVYLHYFNAHSGVNSVQYKVAIFRDSSGQIFEGTITGQGTVVDILEFTYGTTNNRSVWPNTIIDWYNLPAKK